MFCESMKSHSMSVWWYNIFLTLILCYPKSKMAASAFLHIIFTSWVIWSPSESVTMHGEQRAICLLWMLNQHLAWVTLVKVWAEFVRAQNSKWPPFAILIIVIWMVRHTFLIDMVSGATLGKEFIFDVSFIIPHMAYLANWPSLAILNKRCMRRGGGGGALCPPPKLCQFAQNREIVKSKCKQAGTGGQFGFRMVKIQGQEKAIKMTSNVISLTLITPL